MMETLRQLYTLAQVIGTIMVLLKDAQTRRDVNEKLKSMATGLRILQAICWNRAEDAPTDQLDLFERRSLFSRINEELSYDAKNLADYVDMCVERRDRASKPEDNYLSNLFSLMGHMKQVIARAIDLSHGACPRSMYKEEEDTELVGMDGPRDELINKLEDGDVSMKIVSIVGIAGLGKTSLVRVVYHHHQKQQFDCSAFITVPMETGVKGFLREMHRQLEMKNHINIDIEATDVKKLILHIKQFLQDKRYLVVIDDLWKKEYWHDISGSLPNNGHNSRIIITTRLHSIANLCTSGCDEWVYQIPHLEYSDSKTLFLKKFVGSEVGSSNAHTHVFYGILKMCGGTPSEIISLASFLATEVTATKPWQEMMNYVDSAWKQTSTVHVNIPGFEDLKRILSHIYFNLPITLKHCLLYLAVHAQNQMICRTITVRKWIAEGFISEHGKFSHEEVASQYFDQLISRNFIQPVEYGNYLGEETYEVNYVVLHVLRLISREAIFATVLSDVGISNEYAHAVRLSVKCSGSELSIQTEKMDRSVIRSITIVGPAKFHLPTDLPYLRVLDLDGCKDFENSCMEHICRMVMLKYLSLKHTQVTEIPPDIAELQILETLDVRQTKISKLPPEIAQLQYLKTLDIRRTEISSLLPEIGKLQRLKTLAASRTKISCLPPEIGKLQNLKTLDASHTKLSYLPPEIWKLQQLMTLDASCTQISCVPREIINLKNLETLDVRQTQVKELPKEIVLLPKLAHLYFGQCSFPQGVKLPVGSQQLTSVKVLGTVDSREWSESAMEEISGLKEVKVVEIVLYDGPANDNLNDKLLASVGKCEKLEYLIIYGDCNPSDDLTVSPYFPLLKRLKAAGRFMKVPRWMAQLSTLKKLDIKVCKLDQDDLKILGGLPALSNLALALICITRKKEVVITSRLHPEEETTTEGFINLEVFSFECHVPWIKFELGAMPLLNTLQLKLYAYPEGKFPSGIINLLGLKKIILLYSSQYATSCGVKKAVSAVTGEASSHTNVIDLYVNGNYEVLAANGQEASSDGNMVQAANTRADKGVTGSTEIEECN